MRIVIVALAFVLAVSFAALAAEGDAKATGAAAKPAANPDVATVMGKLTKIDGKSLTIAAKEKGSEATKDVVVTVADTTKVFTREMTKEAKPVPAKVEDLKVDQGVRVEFNKTTNVANSITIAVKPAAAAPAAPAAPKAK